MASSRTPTHLAQAVIAGDVRRVRKLLEQGGDVNQTDKNGWHLLHLAAVNDRASVILLLVEAGSDIEARVKVSWTPLHLACVSCSPRAVAALVACGADLDTPARAGDTPLHLALVIVLGKEYPDLRRASLRAARRILQTLLDAGADPRARNEKGQTPADAARERGAPTLATFLEQARGKRSAPRAPRSPPVARSGKRPRAPARRRAPRRA